MFTRKHMLVMESEDYIEDLLYLVLVLLYIEDYILVFLIQ